MSKKTDLAFLVELRMHMEHWRDNSDITNREMAFKMVDDWISELSTKSYNTSHTFSVCHNLN